MDIGKRITFLRTQKNYTVNRLANKAGISQSYLREIELGNKNPTVEILSYLCEVLEISLSYFFDDNAPLGFLEDPLVKRIYELSPKQRATLLGFLDALHEPH